MLKLSVIVPVYNVEQYIEQCIESLVRQTLKEIEFIIVNDGSSDNSICNIKKYKDERIKIITKKNGGLSSARNVGLKEAKGEYIAFVDSDDFININNAFEEIYYLAKKQNADIIVGNAVKYYSKTKTEEIYRDRNEFYIRNLMGEEFLLKFSQAKSMHSPVWLNIYKRDFLEYNKLFFKEGILHEDELFTPKAFLKATNVTIYPKNFYVYRQRQGSIMNSPYNPNKGQDLILIVCELYPIYKNINNNNLKKELMKYLYGMVLSAVLGYKIQNMPVCIKKILIFYSPDLKSIIRSLCLIINLNVYKKLRNRKQNFIP